MNEMLYQQFMEETIKEGTVHEALACVGVEGILHEFESWVKARFTLVADNELAVDWATPRQ